jgi:hypothetical protein
VSTLEDFGRLEQLSRQGFVVRLAADPDNPAGIVAEAFKPTNEDAVTADLIDPVSGASLRRVASAGGSGITDASSRLLSRMPRRLTRGGPRSELRAHSRGGPRRVRRAGPRSRARSPGSSDDPSEPDLDPRGAPA